MNQSDTNTPSSSLATIEYHTPSSCHMAGSARMQITGSTSARMNEIAAEEMGTVREVCVEDATPVEFGTVLFYIEPHAKTPLVSEQS